MASLRRIYHISNPLTPVNKGNCAARRWRVESSAKCYPHHAQPRCSRKRRDMQSLKVIAILAVALTASGAMAQTAPATSQADVDTDIALLRSDVQAQKTDIIAHSMQFTDAQAKAFWPLYRDYSHQQQVI